MLLTQIRWSLLPLLLTHALLCLPTAQAQAPGKPATGAPAATAITLDAPQQAALGIQVASVQAAGAPPLLATATVGTPPGKTVTVSSPYAGQLSRLVVGVGDRVRAGAPLALFTSPMLAEVRRQWQEASLELNNASSALQRDQAMLDEGIIPAVRVQLARNKQAAAMALVRAREAELQAAGMSTTDAVGGGYAAGQLRAPMAGVVTDAMVAVGQRVEPGTLLFQISDDSALQLDLQLSSDKASQMQVGDLVLIPSHAAQGKVVGVSLAVDASQSSKARAVVLSKGRLRLGELVSVTVQPQSKGLASDGPRWSLPARSVTQWNNQAVVFVRTDAGFVAQTVRVLGGNDDVTVVQAPWATGPKVAITGIAALRALLQKDV